MPHLSPMNWIMVPIFMLTMLTTLMVIMWWSFLPNFPQLNVLSSSLLSKKTWKWW